MGLTETWFSDTNCDLYTIDDYQHIYYNRKDRCGGGVSLFLKNDITYNERTDLDISNDIFESIFVEINKEQFSSPSNIIIGVIYKMPNTDISIFNEHIANILNKIKRENKLAYFMGDYNINLMNSSSHTLTEEFLDQFISSSFIPVINKPTRITNHSATLIDNIFTNSFNSSHCLKGIFYINISDHLPVFYIDDFTSKNSENKFILKRFINASSIDIFKSKLNDTNFDELLCESDSQKCFSKFHHVLTTAYNVSFPIKKINIGYKNKCPWLTHSLKKQIKNKNKLYIKMRRYPTKENELNYKQYRNTLNHILRKTERDHVQQLLTQYKSNLSKTWKILKNILNKNKPKKSQTFFKQGTDIIDDPKLIAEHFNSFFVNVGSNLAKKIPNTSTDPLSYLKNHSNNTMFLRPTCETELINIINSLKFSSPGWDEIDITVVKASHDILIKPLVYLINLSLLTGQFPKEMKIANILPIYKSEAHYLFTNYRPISVLTVLSKIFEKIFYIRLSDFFSANNILYKFQFGFREGYSTDAALVTLLDKITHALNKNDFVLGIFLDFSKAFDTVDHKILLDKLYYYGVRGVPFHWIKDYLSERKQYVSYNGATSSYQTVSCGIPQGSILGPLLFLIYINDLPSISNNIFTLLFADDTNMFMSGPNIDDMISKINVELNELVTWLKANKLSLNIKKTHFMIFKPPKMKINCPNNVLIDGKPITRVNEIKFLGVVMDDILSWKKHILFTRSKVAKCIGVLCKARKYINRNYLVNLYYSFMYPYLSYCIIIWGSACVSHLSPLIKIQKVAIRCMCNLAPRTSTTPFFNSTNILKLCDIYYLNAAMFMFKVMHHHPPNLFSHLFTANSDFHSYNTRGKNKLHVPLSKSTSRSQFIIHKGVLIWNHVSSLINVTCKKDCFKKNLKLLLLKTYSIP